MITLVLEISRGISRIFGSDGCCLEVTGSCLILKWSWAQSSLRMSPKSVSPIAWQKSNQMKMAPVRKNSIKETITKNCLFPHLQKQFCLQIFPRRGHSSKYWGKKLIIRKWWVFSWAEILKTSNLCLFWGIIWFVSPGRMWVFSSISRIQFVDCNPPV